MLAEAQWIARSRWISHVIDFLGDPTDEFAAAPGSGMELPHRPEFLILELSPRPTRPHFTYLTAGLSLVPQEPAGPMPHIELVAYSAQRDLRVPQLLWMLARDIASSTADEPAFKAWDLWRAEHLGFRDFMITVAREDDALLDFPNVKLRPEDSRYLLAATGELDGKMFLDVLQLVPLTAAQWELASKQGVGTLLEAINWASCPQTFGWAS
jgi:hypothetical protein